MEPEPFARRVIQLLMSALAALTAAVDSGQSDDVVKRGLDAGLSANLCESLLLLRPKGDRSSLTISTTWSRALLPEQSLVSNQVQLRQEEFAFAELLAPRLRTLPEPKPARFFAFVDVLSGQPVQHDPRPAGEVDFSIFDDEEGEVRARALLTPDQYAVAGAAHLACEPVSFKGTLRRLPRISRIDDVTELTRIQFEPEETTTAEVAGS
jgi:hypothetical protein